jgi:hypothetical protein
MRLYRVNADVQDSGHILIELTIRENCAPPLRMVSSSKTVVKPALLQRRDLHSILLMDGPSPQHCRIALIKSDSRILQQIST